MIVLSSAARPRRDAESLTAGAWSERANRETIDEVVQRLKW